MPDELQEAAAAPVLVDGLSDPRLPRELLAGALSLSLWIASGSLVLAVANGLGENPARRLVLGLLLVTGSALMLWRRYDAATVLRAQPWLVLPLAALYMSAAIADGLIDGAYVAFSITPIGLAVVAARARTVWLCVLLLELGYASGVLLERSAASLIADGDIAGVLGAMVSYPVAALLFLGLRRRFTRFVRGADASLADIRGGGAAYTPALALAIRRSPGALPPAPTFKLTRRERRVVEGLAEGNAAKELAHVWGVSPSTVRTHIRNAKRKTGSRTMRELATLPSRPDWPEATGDEGR